MAPARTATAAAPLAAAAGSDRSGESNGEDKEDSSYWRVWTTADNLETMAPDFYPQVTDSVVQILRRWGATWAGNDDWQSLLNKKSLQHECEESIVALHHHLEKLKHAKEPYIAIDACGGKGLFSVLLSYLRPEQLTKIVLIEKATEINWHHIEIANDLCQRESRPPIEIWPDTNLHDYDELLDRLLALQRPVAMTGIHLCKQLSPSFCGLVNGLGRERCIHACLAPCCLPRAVTAQKHRGKSVERDRKLAAASLAIQLKESPAERQCRLEYTERRRTLRKKPQGGPCFLCQDPSHNLKDCPQLRTKSRAAQIALQQQEHAAVMPCWRCGEMGHYKENCPSSITSASPPARSAPTLTLEVSGVLDDERPFRKYCHLLAGSFQERETRVLETTLENDGKHQSGNWNSERKAIYIVIE